VSSSSQLGPPKSTEAHLKLKISFQVYIYIYKYGMAVREVAAGCAISAHYCSKNVTAPSASIFMQI